MKTGKILLTAAIASILSLSPIFNTINGQSKGETKLYNTVLAKKDLKNAKKFLSKYPSSIYAPKVQRLKDSIVFNNLDKNNVKDYISFLASNPKSFFASAANAHIAQMNKSSITAEQAMEGALSAGLGKEEIAATVGIKNMNQEHIAVILAPKAGTTAYTLALLAQNNGSWEIAKQIEETVYTNDYNLKEFNLLKDAQPVTINGMQYLYFCYTNSSKEIDPRSKIHNNDCEVILNLYSLEDNSIYNILYSGKTQDGIIYGSSMDAEQAGATATEQQKYLIDALSAMENLKPYEQERFQIQELIQWWYKNNPKNAKEVSFGIIPDNSTVINLFNQSKDREKVGNYTVAMLENIFNNTIVVVLNNQTKQYSLAMCQPTPSNDNDLELNTFYGEKGNILALYYFKGKTSVKKRINLLSKKIY